VLLRRAGCDSKENQPVTIDLTPDNNSVSAFAFHPDDGAVFVAEAGGRIYVRAIDDGAVRLIDSGFADNDTVQSLAVSGAGRWLALSNQHDLRLLDLAADTPAAIRLCCDDDTRVLQVMGFSHDSEPLYLVAFHQYSQNGEIRLWRLGDDPVLSGPIRFAVPRKEHDEPNVRVHAIAFSHDDRWLATALDGDNRSILLWPLTPADWLTLACSRLQTAPSGSSAAGPVASLCP
jgi:WD40 repeat protein